LSGEAAKTLHAAIIGKVTEVLQGNQEQVKEFKNATRALGGGQCTTQQVCL
jgi:hypothetical protein